MRTTWMMAATAAVAMMVGGSLAGCDGKIAQCNRLIEVINGEQGTIKSAAGSDPAAFNKLADTLEGVGKKVTAVEVKDEKLVGYRDEYAKMVNDLATASRDTAAALEGKDMTKAAEANKTISEITSRESKLVNDINKYCQGG